MKKSDKLKKQNGYRRQGKKKRREIKTKLHGIGLSVQKKCRATEEIKG